MKVRFLRPVDGRGAGVVKDLPDEEAVRLLRDGVVEVVRPERPIHQQRYEVASSARVENGERRG